MKVTDAIARIKSSIHDISNEYTDAQYIDFLNTAVQQVSSLLIAARWPAFIKETTVRDGDSLPKNYMCCVGTYPLRMTDGTVKIIDDDYETVPFRYFATPDLIDDTTIDLPFTHSGINDVVVMAATLLAGNDNEMDITQDTSIMQALQQAIASGISGTTSG
ncbi:hypothetical protein NXG27_00900 [Megasphaera paucivorans]|uniref:Uncharacterized protein n=1 Tax=Megasphaera paucivorans TaxID=349095 RepID=A0A1G9QBS6_9FIRM|nr:hypothetical protein [Megasphaera paucivorans]SDM08476.1 hypothetical protein SAMN05660299_00182 [Megasphaera paucivorans]